MKPERWQQVEALYHAVLERPAESRADFIRSACGDDEELYREVESLLVAHRGAGQFLDGPPTVIAEQVPQAVPAEKSGDREAVLKALAANLNRCIACHAAYRIGD